MGMRTARKLQEDGSWERIEFSFLRKGDTFKMFEPDGKEVIDDFGKNIFIAAANPYLMHPGIWIIEVIDEDPIDEEDSIDD